MLDRKQISIKQYPKNEIIESLENISGEETIILDFDETLLLRNSTGEYLNNLQPRFLGLLLLKILYILKPWKWLFYSKEEDVVRDWFLILTTTLLLPWNLILWQFIAYRLAKEYTNWQLVEVLNRNNQANIIIATLGFNILVNPILKHIPIHSNKIISCRFWLGIKDRERGKLAQVKDFLGETKLKRSIAVTDSLDDLPLLMEVAKPFLIVWNEAKYICEKPKMYLPLMYLHKVKRVGENYIIKVILGEDWIVLFLALSLLSSNPIIHTISILTLMFSFWCIYEFGYYENDLVAEKYEAQPKLSQTYHNHKLLMHWLLPWIWSIPLGILGILLFKVSQFTSFTDFIIWKDTNNIINTIKYPLGCWVGFLLVSRLCFWIYNYLNKQTRIWVYIILQASRYCGYLVVTAINFVGISLLWAHILSRSISYIVYRYAGGKKTDWPVKLPEQFLRLLLFTSILTLISIVQKNIYLIYNWQTAIIYLWCLLKARKEIKEIVNNIQFIWQDRGNLVNNKTVTD